METLKPERLYKWLIRISIIATLFVASVFVSYFLTFRNGLSTDTTAWGTFGDFVGGTLNPILSFFGLIALLLTIALQSKELESTRKELERAASAQEKTEKLLAEQSKTQLKQQFEGTFFALIEQHNKAIEKLTNPNSRFPDGKSDLDMITQATLSESKPSLKSAKSQLEKMNNICGHYFRILYQLLKFIATNCPTSEIGSEFDTTKIKHSHLSPDEKMYSNIVRSFLGHNITQLLAVNCFCEDEEDIYWKYKLLLERYSFLEHMPFEVNRKESKPLTEAKAHYSRQAFGNSNFMHLEDQRITSQ